VDERNLCANLWIVRLSEVRGMFSLSNVGWCILLVILALGEVFGPFLGWLDRAQLR